jgi:hypothetical protein
MTSILQKSLSSLRIQYASNLLVPFKEKSKITSLLKPVAPVLALLGNIGFPQCEKTKTFLQWCNDTYETVLWVPGSMEYETPPEHVYTWKENADLCYETIIKNNLNRIIFCQNYIYRQTSFSVSLLATPLWHPNMIQSSASRYRKIYSSIHNNGILRTLTSDRLSCFMEDDSKWISDCTKNFTDPCILLTHSHATHKDAISALKSNNMLFHLYGYDSNGVEKTRHYINVTSKSCRTSINMDGHSGFLKNAVLEYKPQTESSLYNASVNYILYNSSPILKY